MNESEKQKELQERLNKQSNEYKVAVAMTVAVDSIYKKYLAMERTEENEEKMAKEVSDIWTDGLKAFRAQVSSALLLVLSDQGKAFNVPNNAEAIKTKLIMFAMLIGKTADEDTLAFMAKAEKAAPDRIGYEMTDCDDPRVSDIADVTSRFPPCQGRA